MNKLVLYYEKPHVVMDEDIHNFILARSPQLSADALEDYSTYLSIEDIEKDIIEDYFDDILKGMDIGDRSAIIGKLRDYNNDDYDELFITILIPAILDMVYDEVYLKVCDEPSFKNSKLTYKAMTLNKDGLRVYIDVN